MPEFIPGLQLSELFFREAVRPLLDRHFPGLACSAGLLGWGSDVLGYDSPRSTDHMWGPRLLLFLAEADFETYHEAVSRQLGRSLPPVFRGYSTHFGPPDPQGVRLAGPASPGQPVSHLVELHTVESYVKSLLGFDLEAEITALDWLGWPEQRLLSLTAGRVFEDGLGSLEPLRRRLAYYPRDVWLYRMGAAWRRIEQEMAFMGRCGEAGDELGSRVVAARLVREIMRLAFLQEQRYAPYSKWLGTAFAGLASGPALHHPLLQALSGPDWPARQAGLAAAYKILARQHNRLGVTGPLAEGVKPYFGRPYLVPEADFAAELLAAILSPELRRIKLPIGGVDQFADSADLLEDPRLSRQARLFYE